MLGNKDIGIKNPEFLAKTHFLFNKIDLVFSRIYENVETH